VRRPLRDIMAGVDTSMPVILLDHQPFGLNEARENGVDVQLSGHTHHGQLWPLNLITNALYEVSWGMKQVNGSVVYVSSGLGTWGPPVRLGNRPEIVVLTLSSAFDEGYR
jgi:predicted MPP superfamily phosphohydrolase